MPIAGLAKRLGVARSTVQQRLARLEGAGVIAGYTVRLGVAPPEGITAYVHLTVDPKFGTRTADELAVIPEIRELHAVSGAFDLLAVVRAPSPVAIDETLDRITRVGGVVRTSSSIVLSTKVHRRSGA